MSEKRNFKGVWIPAGLWLCNELSLNEKVLLIEIDSLQDPVKGCYKSNQAFAEFFGLSASRISQMITSLKEKGFLKSKEIIKGKQVVERQLFLTKKMDLFDTPHPIEKTKGGYLENEKGYLISKRGYLENCEGRGNSLGVTGEGERARANAAPDELQTQNPTPVNQSDLTTPSSESAAPAAVPAPAHQTTLDDNGKPVNTHPLVDDWQPDVDTLTAGLRRSGIPLDVCHCLADDLELRANFVNHALANPGRNHTANSWNLKLASWLQRDWQNLKRPMTPEAYRLARGLDTDTAAHAQLAAECPLDQIHALWCQHLGNIKPTPPLADWKRTNAAQALATRWAEGFTAPMQSDASRMRYVDQEDSLGWWDWLFSSISKTESLRNDDWVNLIRLGSPDIFATVLAELARPTGSQ